MGVNQIKQFLKNSLFFLRITDGDGLLSLTHLTIFVSLYKIFMAQTYSIAEVATLLTGMIAYGYKKHLLKNKANLTDENKAAISKVEQKIAQLADKQGAVAAALGFKPVNK